ncbi:MAG TPA: hypothetical protein VHC97_19920 [Thermoanaerobaculia bacterium]|jgi:hypothetical protein|nr:hypothetical protein [Thermoanaerobaculia bacterium]
MDHAYIEENGLVERYHQGLLPPDEEARFEEHFVTCAGCMEQLELARGFQRGIKSMVTEDAVRAAVVAQVGLFAWLARRGRLVQWGLALAALLLAAGLPSLWFAAQGRNEQQAMAQRIREIEAGRHTKEDLERRLAETEQRRNEERRDLEAKLAQAQKPATPSPGVLDRPLANLPVVLLTAVRGEGEPAATIDLARTGDLLALAVDAGADPRFVSYRAKITRTGGGTVYSQEGLKPNALETLMITFPKTFFKPGDYRLTIEGVKADGGVLEVGGYPFRVR